MATQKITIQGMSCGHCLDRVRQAITTAPGAKVEALEIGAATVGYDPEVTTAEAIVRRISEAGYPAVLAGGPDAPVTTSEWLVLAAGIAAIVWVNWYFFMAGRGAAAAAAPVTAGRQEVTITVQGGYSPAAVQVRRGAPVRLLFDRRETAGCSEEIVLPDFGVRKFLPAHQVTPIDLEPDQAGTFEFTCGMGMLRGRLIVE